MVADTTRATGTSVREANQTFPVSNAKRWTGRIISALPVLFCIFDGVMKLVKPPVVVQATVQLGFPESTIVPIGVILLTGYLGGAVATHVRVGAGLFPILFPVVFAMLIWGGLYLREERLRPL